MPRFLSSAWLQAMADLAAEVDPQDEGAEPLTLRQRITTPGSEPVVYDLRIDRSGVAVVVDAVDADADVCFDQDRATATALAQGDLHPELALSTGRLRVSGRAEALRPWRPTLDALDDALAPLRADTQW